MHDPETPGDYSEIYDPSYQFFEAPDRAYYVQIAVGGWDYVSFCYERHLGRYVNDCITAAPVELKIFTLPITEHPEGSTVSIKTSGYIPDGGFLTEDDLCSVYGY